MRPIRIRVQHRTDETVSDHEFYASPIRLGRNPLNDLPLPHPFVSSWHAVIRFDDATARFFDLGSTNGTSRDGVRIFAGEHLDITADPVVVQIGDLDLTMTRAESGAGTAAGPPEVEWMQRPSTGAHRAGAIDTTQQPEGPSISPNQTAHMPIGQVHAAMAVLRPSFEAMRERRLQFERELREQVASFPAHARQQGEAFIRREFLDVAESSAGAEAGASAVRRLSEELVPEVLPPGSEEEERRFLSLVRDVLEACAKSLVELQNGQEQFGNEMGVRAVKEFTPLHVAATPTEVLAYLLDWRHGGPHRLPELVGVFADVMIHQVALLNGVVEGSRALLAQLDPEEIERRLGPGWGKRTGAKWQAYMRRFAELTREDDALAELLFGPEFAKAYAEVGGEQQPPQYDGS